MRTLWEISTHIMKVFWYQKGSLRKMLELCFKRQDKYLTWECLFESEVQNLTVHWNKLLESLIVSCGIFIIKRVFSDDSKVTGWNVFLIFCIFNAQGGLCAEIQWGTSTCPRWTQYLCWANSVHSCSRTESRGKFSNKNRKALRDKSKKYHILGIFFGES